MRRTAWASWWRPSRPSEPLSVATLVLGPGGDEPVLSICCFRYRPAGEADEACLDALNTEVLHAVRARDALVDEILAAGRQLS